MPEYLPSRNSPTVGTLSRPVLAVLLLVFAFVLAVFSYQAVLFVRQYRDIERTVTTKVQDSARVIEQHIKWTIHSSDLLLKRTIDTFGSRDFSAIRNDEAAWWELRTIALDLPQIGFLSLIDANGRGVLSSRFFPTPDVDLTNRRYFAAHAIDAEDFHIGEAIKARVGGDTHFTISRRIIRPDGSFAGIAVLGISIEYFAGFRQQLGLGPGSSVGVLKLTGDIVIRTEIRDRDLGINVRNHEIFTQHLPRAPAGVYNTISPVDGVARTVGYRAVGGLPLVIAVGMSREAAIREWQSRLARDGLLGLATLVVMGVLSWAALRAVRREQLALADAQMARIAAERANEAKTRFLAAASHDLRQPFQAMRIQHHLLSDRLTDEQAIHLAQRLGDTMAMGEELLHALLDISSLQAGIVNPTISAFRIDPVLARLAAEFGEKAADKGLAIRHVPCSAWVRSDPILLNRIIRNLLSNAVRYTQRGRIVVGCRHAGGRLRIEVWDTGIGIPEQQIPAIFEDFYQIGNPQRDRNEGLGLGLSVVRKTADLLGHDITVRSWPGKGSVFAVTVPLAEPQEAAEPVILAIPPVDPQPDTKSTVLIIEDDAIQLLSLEDLFERWGWNVLSAANSDEALTLIGRTQEPPTLILSDMRLPGGRTGLQTIAAVREILGREVPAIILTGDTDPARLREVDAAGCTLLHKPMDPLLLKQKLESAPETENVVR